MNEQTHTPLVAGQSHLSNIPAEILHEILKHAAKAPTQQVLPNPLIQTSNMVGSQVAALLLQNCTLQLECRHMASHHFWATSLYRSAAKGGYLHSPGLPTIRGSNVRWSKFRQLTQHDEMLKTVKSLYIKLSWMRGLTFTIPFHHDKPPTITTHTWYRSRNDTDSDSFPQLRPDMKHWIQTSHFCSVAWIENFLTDMRRQCIAFWVKLASRIYLVRHAHDVAMAEMIDLQHCAECPVALRWEHPRVAVPKIVGFAEVKWLKDDFCRQEADREGEALFRQNMEEAMDREAEMFKRWIGEKMEGKAEKYKRLVAEQVGNEVLPHRTLRRRSV